jgi:hypothetical protein
VLVLPGSVQTVGLVATAQWYVELYLLAWLIAGSANRIGLAAFAMTGPFSLLFAPLAVLRRPAGWPIVLAGAAVQAVGFAISPRDPFTRTPPIAGGSRLPRHAAPFFGEFALAQIPLAQAVAAILLVTVLAAIAIGSDRIMAGFRRRGNRHGCRRDVRWGVERHVLRVARRAVFSRSQLRVRALRPATPALGVAWVLAALLTMGIVDDFCVPARDYYGWLH